MLCCFEPVKYCRAAPNEISGTTRRSTCTPLVSRIDIFVSPRAKHLGQPAVVGQMVHHTLCIFGDGQKIQIAHGILAAAITAGGFDFLDSPATVHVAENRLDVLIGLGPKHAAVGF